MFGVNDQIFPVWPALSQSPITQLFGWGTLAHFAFEANRHLFSLASLLAPYLSVYACLHCVDPYALLKGCSLCTFAVETSLAIVPTSPITMPDGRRSMTFPSFPIDGCHRREAMLSNHRANCGESGGATIEDGESSGTFIPCPTATGSGWQT